MTRSTVYDMTDRKRLEAQLHQAQKMDAIGRLAGGIAHDFNNLLTAITGFSMLLLERLRPGSEMYEDVQEIHRAGVRAADLTRQLLAFSRKQVLQPRTIDLNEIITSMERLLRRLISENISLSVQLQRSLGVTRADPGQIEQVLLNLCVNARDAMPSGGSLIIETRNVEVAGTRDEVPAGSYVLFSVADTGVGMTAETRAHIFEPFFTTKPVGKGTGLGLSTVYGIVKQSGGHITVESAPGKGTTFSIYLPRVEAPKEPSSDPSLSGERPRGGETVLVVEDDSGVRSLIRGLLRDQGYRVLEASDGAEALRVSERHRAPIDLLITDLVMPNLGGRELVGRLGKERSGMRILFMSGYEEQSIVGSPPLGPGMGFMGKPFTPEALCRTVRAMLNG